MSKKKQTRAQGIIKNEKLMTFSLVVSLLVFTLGVGFVYYLFYLEKMLH